MPINHFLFKTPYTKANNDTIFIGGYLCTQLVDKLALYAVSQNEAKTRMLSEIIYDFVTELDSNELCKKIANNAAVEYSTMQNKTKYKTYEKSLKALLQRKGLSNGIIKEVLDALKLIINENQKK